ncbi:Protein TRANSPARENT TESTA 12 [Hordeum vulgare]|nr:Protein TRANSPARENT TESTA 12 [Hordeum vulgare]
MSLCRRGSSGYRGVRERRSGVYYVEIRSGDVRLGLGTYETSHEATSAYDAAAWRLGRPRAQMNFQDVHTHEQAQDLAPSPRLITDQDREEHRRRQRRLLVVEEDERAMAEWRRRHPEDVATENAFWAERTTRRPGPKATGLPLDLEGDFEENEEVKEEEKEESRMEVDEEQESKKEAPPLVVGEDQQETAEEASPLDE